MPRFDKQAYYDSIAESYADYVVSPYELGVDLSLPDDVDAWLEAGGEEKVAVDFGCGAGQSLELIAGRAGRALGLDFSLGMLTESARRLSDVEGCVRKPLRPSSLPQWLKGAPTNETRFFQGDLHRLEVFAGSVDLAIASNSITDSTLADSLHMFEQVAASVRPGGELLSLFPSWDATEYVMDLVEAAGDADDELGTLDDEGVYEIDGLRQKFWKPEEIEAACEANGLRVARLEKILFPWDAMAEAGWGDFEGEPEMWDWYLRAVRY